VKRGPRRLSINPFSKSPSMPLRRGRRLRVQGIGRGIHMCSDVVNLGVWWCVGEMLSAAHVYVSPPATMPFLKYTCKSPSLSSPQIYTPSFPHPHHCFLRSQPSNATLQRPRCARCPCPSRPGPNGHGPRPKCPESQTPCLACPPPIPPMCTDLSLAPQIQGR
jgi:hypothetical protein